MAARSFKEGAPSIKSSNTTNTKTQTDPLPANGDAGVGNLQGEGDRESVFLGDVPRLWQEGDPYRFSPKRRGDPWEESMKRVDLYDDEMCRAWKEDVDTLLVFAGLFSAAVTAFIIESYKWLQPNNFNSDTILLMLQRIALDSNVQVSTSGQTNFTTASAVRINAVWFLSLIFSLSTVLIGILCKQWLREHRRDTPCSSSKEALELRQLRFESLEKWGIPALLASLPLILQLALVLFFYGILDLLWSLNIVVAAICTAATAISVSIPFLTTILPTCYLFKYSSLIDEDEAHICPYKSPQAWLFYKLMTFLPFNGHTPFQNWASGDLFLLRKHSPLKRLQLHSVFLLRGLRWMVKTFCDSSVMAKHMFHCFQNLPVDIAAFATKREGEFSRDTIYYHFFENSAWDLDLGKFLAELFLRQINSPAPAHSGRAVGDPLRSFWNLAVLDFVGDGQEALQLHLEFLQQIIATIRCYCAEDRITLFDMNPLMIVCKGLWRHPDPVIRQQSICIVDDFEAWISRTSEELQREFIPSFASSITDTIFSEDERAPTSALILSDRGRAFIKLLDKYLAAQDIDLDKYSLQEVPMSWQEDIPIPNNVGGSLVETVSARGPETEILRRFQFCWLSTRFQHSQAEPCALYTCTRTMLSINFMFILLVVSWISLYLNNRATVSPLKNCLTHNTLNDFINCLDAFTVSPNFYDTSSYATAQPTKEENSAWKSVVHSMLNTNADDCSDITLPSALAYIYAITAFHDADTTRTFCVLFETTASVYRNYTKGWGLMVVPASASAISRHIHLSAPHPQADINTPQQAAAIFALSGAHSLLISGRLRSAYAVQTDCIVSAGSTKGYSKTDPTHDVDEPFSVANREIREWQNANGGCPSETCAYVQFHGKAASSCAADTMFISSGLGNSNSAISWYQDLSFDIPARRVRDIVRTVFPTWTASLPSDDPTCVLTATDNVFGRLINGVPDNSICTTEADSSIATGEFIHIEQAIVSRKSDVYDQWGEVLRRAFRAICAEGTVEDSKNGLCIDS